jgi:T5SS/PEP-CTERM-associated repeat protein
MIKASYPLRSRFLAAALVTAVGLLFPARADTYIFKGDAVLVTPTSTDEPVVDAYYITQSGSFNNPASWNAGLSLYVPGLGEYPSSGPGPGDSVTITGYPANYSPPQLNVYIADNTYLGISGDGFNVTGASGTVSYLGVYGPGTIQLGGLTVTGSGIGVTTFLSVGGIPLFDSLDNVTGYAPSTQTVTGGALSTTSLILSAGTALEPGNGATSSTPDPVADAGSLTINGATFLSNQAQIYGLDYGASTGFITPPGGSESSPSDFAYQISPVTLQSARLGATIELDLIGVDPLAYPNVSGVTTLNADNSTITAGNVVIATGQTGYGSGTAGAPAILSLTNGSSLTAMGTSPGSSSLFVGDTGNGTMMASGGSTIVDNQAVIGNATGSTGYVDINSSTWTNYGYLAVGNNGVGTLIIEHDGVVKNAGENGNAFISGLQGSSGSYATVTGSGALWQTSGYFEVAGSGTGTLNVDDEAQVITGDELEIGAGSGTTGTVNIEGGGQVTTNTAQGEGTSSTVVGAAAGSTGILHIDGSGSQLESKGDLSIGYEGKRNRLDHQWRQASRR